eukprot:2360406-Pyramimonas_sp.AAC.1
MTAKVSPRPHLRPHDPRHWDIPEGRPGETCCPWRTSPPASPDREGGLERECKTTPSAVTRD